jgi:serine/threonine-protein kinase RsbW
VFQADPVSVRQALEGMLVCPPLSELSDDDRGTAELVLAEILNNVAEHAYSEAGGRVEVRLEPGPAGLQCLILDEGREMPGGQLPEGRLPGGPGVALDDLPEGGFGWHLIWSLCADLTYTRAQGQNRLSFRLATGS